MIKKIWNQIIRPIQDFITSLRIVRLLIPYCKLEFLAGDSGMNVLERIRHLFRGLWTIVRFFVELIKTIMFFIRERRETSDKT